MTSFESVRGRVQTVLIHGGITAVAGAAMLGIGTTVYAQQATPSAGTEATTEAGSGIATSRRAEHDAFLDALAANLGVADGETVDAAIRTTLKQTIDERLAAGEISADLATELKAAVDAGDVPLGLHLTGVGRLGGHDLDGRGGFGGDRHHRGPGRDANGSDKDDGTILPDVATPAAAEVADL